VSGALAGGRRWPARLFRVPAWGTREYGVPGVASTSRRPLLRSGKRGARGQGQWHDECGRKVKTRRGETRRDETRWNRGRLLVLANPADTRSHVPRGGHREAGPAQDEGQVVVCAPEVSATARQRGSAVVRWCGGAVVRATSHAVTSGRNAVSIDYDKRARCGSWRRNMADATIRSCATTGEGLFEGLQWLSQNVKGTKS
jgi:hypothetical protein